MTDPALHLLVSQRPLPVDRSQPRAFTLRTLARTIAERAGHGMLSADVDPAPQSYTSLWKAGLRRDRMPDLVEEAAGMKGGGDLVEEVEGKAEEESKETG